MVKLAKFLLSLHVQNLDWPESIDLAFDGRGAAKLI